MARTIQQRRPVAHVPLVLGVLRRIEGSGQNDVKMHAKAASQCSQCHRGHSPLVFHTEHPPMTRLADHEAPVEGLLAIQYEVVPPHRTNRDEERRVYPVLRRGPMAYDTVNVQNLPGDNGRQAENHTAGPTHLLLEIAPVGVPALAIMALARQGREGLPLEQAPPPPAPACRIRERVEDEDRLLEASQRAPGPGDMVTRATGPQALEGDGRRRVAGRQGGEARAHPLPVGRHPVERQSPLAGVKERREGAIIPLGSKPVAPLPVEPTEAWTAAFPKHRKRRNMQRHLAMGVGRVLCRGASRLRREPAIQDGRRIPLRACDRHGIEGGVVVGNAGRACQGIVAEAGTRGPPQAPTGQEKPLTIAARGAPIAPPWRGVEGRDGLDDIGQGARSASACSYQSALCGRSA